MRYFCIWIGATAFSEEVVGDQALFVGSLLAAELEPRLRTAAGASSWQVCCTMCYFCVRGGESWGDSWGLLQ
jgi:hypothetical protein